MVQTYTEHLDPNDEELLLSAGYSPGAIASWSEDVRARRVEELRITVEDVLEDGLGREDELGRQQMWENTEPDQASGRAGPDKDKEAMSPDDPKTPATCRIRWSSIFGIVMVCALAYGVFLRDRPIERQPAPGWEELRQCKVTSSLGGRRSLTLNRDGSAGVGESVPQGEGKDDKFSAILGRWKYDPASKTYSVTFKDETNRYSVLTRGGIATCILVKGDFGAADLRASWFSTESDDYDPRDADYEPREQ